MSNKLARKTKNKIERSWMWNEIEKQGAANEVKRYFVSFGVPMVKNSLEICLWILHDKFGFGEKRLKRVHDSINAYLVSNLNGDLQVDMLPEALQKMKTSCDVRAVAMKVPQRCRINMSKMKRVNNPNEFKTRLKFNIYKTKSKSPSTTASRSFPSLCIGFIALTPLPIEAGQFPFAQNSQSSVTY